MTLSYALNIKTASLIEILFCILVYTVPFRKKKYFFPRTLLCILCFAAAIYPLCVFYTITPKFTANTIITFSFYIGAFLSLQFLYKESTTEYLLALSAGAATQVLVGKTIEFIYYFLGKDPYQSLSFFDTFLFPSWVNWGIYYILHFLLIYLFSRLFRRKETYTHTGRFMHLIVLFSIIIIISLILLTTYSRPLEPQNKELALVIRIFSFLCSLLTLFAQKVILEQEKVQEQLSITSELLYTEKKQYENIKDDMDSINRMCHDLKHQLSQYAGKLTQKELEELKNAISVYDSTIKTGHEILDIILYKKQNFFTQNHIQFSCIANGDCLSFLSPPHAYSLFYNAIENAVDAVMKLTNPDMRIISLNISDSTGIVEIHMTNYFNQKCFFKNGLPQTSNPDSGHHGFGVRNMQYIVEQYHGKINFSTNRNIFYLDIFFPPAV